MESLIEEVFRYFKEICEIPHGSGNTKKISDYCAAFAVRNGLRYRQDEYHNVIIWKPASKGRETHPTVILQGHLDMVCVKEADCGRDLSREGLKLATDGDWIYAKQTSLGADDGIAVAYALAVLASDRIDHPPLEVVFTVDEEIGMLGAAAIDLSDIRGRLMLNIDSEEEGIFLAGCAGGATVVCSLPVQEEMAGGIPAEIEIKGLTGGHSGTEIVLQRANANVLLGRLLLYLSSKCTFSLVQAEGGEKDNAIAKAAAVRLLVPPAETERLQNALAAFERTVRREYEATDAQLAVTLKLGETVERRLCCDPDSTRRLTAALVHLPCGVQKMSNDIAGLVQTSLNLGIVKETRRADGTWFDLSYSVRSALRSEKAFLVEKLCDLMALLGGTSKVSGEYPAWEFRQDSPLRDRMIEIYQKTFHKPPVVETIHAGLECGVLADKLPGLDCVSFGPDIKDIHTTRERLSRSSAERTWNFLLAVLKAV